VFVFVLLKNKIPSLFYVTLKYCHWYYVILWVQVGILRGRCVHIFVIAVFVHVSCVPALTFRMLKFMNVRNTGNLSFCDVVQGKRCNCYLYLLGCGNWDSVVGIVTRYGVDGPGIESQWRRDFLHLSRLPLGPTQPPIEWIPGLSWE
jgi:hypothetical protein